MNSRERVLTALRHEEPDMVPIDFGGTTKSWLVCHRRISSPALRQSNNIGLIL